MDTSALHFWPTSRRLQRERAKFPLIVIRHVDYSLTHSSNEHAFLDAMNYLCYESATVIGTWSLCLLVGIGYEDRCPLM